MLIYILRDTDAAQSLILDSTMPFSQKSSTGVSVLLQGVELGAINVPLHTVYLHSDLVSGPVAVGLRPCLPVQGISLILGNDLAGDKVVVNPQVLEIPCKDTKWEQGKQFEGLFPSYVVTRAMAKATQIGTHTEKDDELRDEKLTPAESVGTSPGRTQDSSQSARTDALQISVKPHTAGKPKESVKNIMLSTQRLILDQDKDQEIRKLKQHALDEKEASKVPVCYFVKDGVLMRKWRPPDAEASHEWKIIYQIVVPPAYRHDILSLAHETPLAGHLGINKTYYKVLNHFYWPGLRGDTKLFCKTCHTCQLVGKPNGKPPIAPLKPIPVMEEPFSRISWTVWDPYQKHARETSTSQLLCVPPPDFLRQFL